MSVYDFDEYKPLILGILKKMPQEGYGQFRKMAAHLQVNSVIISQIFKGNRELSPEQALDLSQYFGFSEMETEYFVLLVQKERAANHRLKSHLQTRIAKIREQSKDLKSRLPQDQQLSDEAKAIFYSNWYYSGIRLLSSIPGFQNVDSIAEHFGLPRAHVKKATDFLLTHGLCVEEKGLLKMGPKVTHLESSSPLIARHHSNWRLRSMNSAENLSKEELMYTAPMSLSEKDFEWVRARLVELIESVVGRAKESDSERLACLNVDWIAVGKRS
jgi:uncharacterized protein (TIGR02147 family)